MGEIQQGQKAARAVARRRRANIEGEPVRQEVRLSAEERATLAEAAAEAGMTLPRYLVECALNPAPAVVSSEGKSSGGEPWLPWPKRKTLAGILMAAAAELAEVRDRQLAPLGSNANQLARSANIDGEVGAEIAALPDAVRAVLEKVDARSAEILALAQQVARR